MNFEVHDRALLCLLHSWDLSDGVLPKYMLAELKDKGDRIEKDWSLTVISRHRLMNVDLMKDLARALNGWCFEGYFPPEYTVHQRLYVPPVETPLQKELNDKLQEERDKGWTSEEGIREIIKWIGSNIQALYEEHPKLDFQNVRKFGNI